MTASRDAPRLVFADLDEAVQAVRENGLRLSTPRRLVLEALFAAEGPVSAAHLARTLSLDESSIYRNLETLESHGMIRHVHLGHGPGLYTLLAHDEVEYLYCEHCEKVTEAAPHQLDTVRQEIRERFGYTPRFTHFAIVGVCEDCAPESQARLDADDNPADDARAETGPYKHSEPRASPRGVSALQPG